MKRCPLCDKIWEPDKVFCPWDGHRLKEIIDAPIASQNIDKKARPEVEFELFSEIQGENIASQPRDYQITETQGLVDIALNALHQARERDQEAVRDQMKLMENF